MDKKPEQRQLIIIERPVSAYTAWKISAIFHPTGA
jgi:hypothetical protein